MYKLRIGCAILLAIIGFGVYCSLSQPLPEMRPKTVLNTKLENCTVAIETLHRNRLAAEIEACLNYGVRYICLPQDDECHKDLLGYCRIRTFRLLQFQIQQCINSEEIDLFLKSLPQDFLAIPDNDPV
jgi:hypothetical protein